MDTALKIITYTYLHSCSLILWGNSIFTILYSFNPLQVLTKSVQERGCGALQVRRNLTIRASQNFSRIHMGITQQVVTDFFLSFLRSKIVVTSNYYKNTVCIQVSSYESYRKKRRHYKEHRNSRYTLVFIPDAQLSFLDDLALYL
jgi:hypothetical protein